MFSAQYTLDKKAWMISAVLSKWLEELDDDMQHQNRKVCLLLDNCLARHIPEHHLKNVQLRYIPPNATSILQLVDQGIINSVKCMYNHRMIDKLLLNLELKRNTKINIFVTIEMVVAAWKVTRTSVIVNCFKHIGFVASIAEAVSSSASP